MHACQARTPTLVCERMLVKGAARGLQLLGAALNCPARALLEEAAQLLWAMDIACEMWGRCDLLLLLSLVTCEDEGACAQQTALKGSAIAAINQHQIPPSLLPLRVAVEQNLE